MRFPVEQENSIYGVGLESEDNNVDTNMIAATGEMEPVGEDDDDCSMIYNLPLFFVNGYPASLDNVTASQLEKFITLMLRCSSGQDPVRFLEKPVWWPKNIAFSNPFVRPQNVGPDWLESLKQLVLKCYMYFKSDYLLKFCSHLAKYPHAKLVFRDNWDSTTSLYHKGTGKLLATFRNENMNYDKVVENSRKKLLTQNNINQNAINKNKKTQQKNHSPLPACVVQSQSEEIYLCDNCDAEFGDLERMKSHEKICNGPIQSTRKERSVSPLSDCEIIEEEELNQSQFMEYFHLATSKVPLTKKLIRPTPENICYDFKTTRSSTRRDRALLQISRCPSIPFSSPAGLKMLSKSKQLDEAAQLERLERLERHTTAPPLFCTNRPKWLDKTPSYSRWSVTFKPNKEKDNSSLSQSNYVRKYSFVIGRRPKRKINLRSALFNYVCRPIYVQLDKLTDEMIENLKLHPWNAPTPRFSNVLLRRQKARRTGKRKLSNSISESILEDIQSENPKAILLVDLCSSDEEESSNTNSSDENRDPRNIFSSARTSNNYYKHFALKKKSNEPSLRGNVLTNNDKHTSNTQPVNTIFDTRKTLP